MANINEIEQLLNRQIMDRLEKTIAASLTAAFETRMAALGGGSLTLDAETVKHQVLMNYFDFVDLLKANRH